MIGTGLPMSNVMYQVARFGAVGLAATITHVLVVVAAVELAGISVLPAKFAGFLAAVLVIYFGNHRWTFECNGAHARYLPRFVAVAALAFALGQVIVWVVIERAGGAFPIAVATVALILPAFGFVASRAFIFKEPSVSVDEAYRQVAL
jgi:putative flippase GtrA